MCLYTACLNTTKQGLCNNLREGKSARYVENITYNCSVHGFVNAYNCQCSKTCSKVNEDQPYLDDIIPSYRSTVDFMQIQVSKKAWEDYQSDFDVH